MITSRMKNGQIILFITTSLCYMCFVKPAHGANLGDKCDISVNVTGTCKLLNDCPRALIQKELQKPIQYCGEEKDSIVCCPNIGEITNQQCEVYGRETTKNSTCINEGTTLVSHGVNAKPNEFPHMALLGYGKEDNKVWLCGGVLISNQYVLTAAHCSYSRKPESDAKWVRLGELNQGGELTTNSVDYTIKKFIKHPLYKARIINHDIALILLDREVKFSVHIRPACLNTISVFPIEKKMIATVWHLQSYEKPTLHKVPVQQIEYNECRKFYAFSYPLRHIPQHITDSFICTGDSIELKHTCRWDTGGPLQIYHDTVHCMLSITGFSTSGILICGGNEIPRAYTRVFDYIEWIENIVWI